MNIENIKSELQMTNFYFEKLNITRSADIKTNELNIDLKKKIDNNGNHSFNITLILTISGTDINIYIEAIGSFVYKSSINDDLTEQNIINNNTVAIMFPYIRSQVTLLTSQPNMTPIVIPPINVNRLLEETENKIH